MHYFNQTMAYLATHWWAAGAVIVWLGALVGGMQHEFDSWRFRRTMRRNAELRTRIVSGRKTGRT